MSRFKSSIAARKSGGAAGPAPARPPTDLAIDLEDDEEEQKSAEIRPQQRQQVKQDVIMITDKNVGEASQRTSQPLKQQQQLRNPVVNEIQTEEEEVESSHVSVED